MIDVYSRADLIFNRSKKDIPGININEELHFELLEAFSHLYGEIPFPIKKTEEFRYFFDNRYFSYGDGIVLYSFIRHFNPKK